MVSGLALVPWLSGCRGAESPAVDESDTAHEGRPNDTSTSGGDDTSSSDEDEGGTSGDDLPVEAGWAFVDATREAGLDARRVDPPAQAPNCLVGVTMPGDTCGTERTFGGVTAADFDDDGDVDLYFPDLWGDPQLFENDGTGTFTDTTAARGLDDGFSGGGAAFVDVDKDGDLDLFVAAGTENQHRLYLQEDGYFTGAGPSAGAMGYYNDDHFSTSIAVGDINLDGWPDLFVGSWKQDFNPGVTPRPFTWLLINAGENQPGAFFDRTIEAGLNNVGTISFRTWVFTPAMVDLDNDDWPDVLTIADFGRSELHWNPGSFPLVADMNSGAGEEENGMGLAIADVDADGDWDYFVSSIRDPLGLCEQGGCNWGTDGNRYYRNEGDRSFTEHAAELGLDDAGWGWGALFADFDLDSRMELFVTNGWIDNTLELYAIFKNDPNRLFEMGSGLGASAAWEPWDDVAASVDADTRGQGRGAIAFDLEGDGDLDILIARYGEPPLLLRNERGAPGHWIEIEARGSEGLSHGRDAQVAIQREVGEPWQRLLIGAPSYLGHGALSAHAGLTRDEVAGLRVCWPGSRRMYEATDVAADRTVRVLEGEATVEVGGPCGLAVVE